MGNHGKLASLGTLAVLAAFLPHHNVSGAEGSLWLLKQRLQLGLELAERAGSPRGWRTIAVAAIRAGGAAAAADRRARAGAPTLASAIRVPQLLLQAPQHRTQSVHSRLVQVSVLCECLRNTDWRCLQKQKRKEIVHSLLAEGKKKKNEQPTDTAEECHSNAIAKTQNPK